VVIPLRVPLSSHAPLRGIFDRKEQRISDFQPGTKDTEQKEHCTFGKMDVCKASALHTSIFFGYFMPEL
jgi:hypothetical protein